MAHSPQYLSARTRARERDRSYSIKNDEKRVGVSHGRI